MQKAPTRAARLLPPLFASMLLAGCALFGTEEDTEAVDATSTRQMLYEAAQRSLRTGNFSDSVTRLERLEARFPFGPYAEQAQLELIYANYMAWDIEAARNAADRFIRLHPQHPNVDYAYYMRGLAATARSRGVLNRLFAIDESKRDVTTARKAWRDFDEFLKLFPSSEYARDARQRMIHLRNVLAQSEVNVATWYMSRGAYVAAANRARYAIENYSQTPAAPDALAILVESSWKLGLTETANDTLRVLALNYPRISRLRRQRQPGAGRRDPESRPVVDEHGHVRPARSTPNASAAAHPAARAGLRAIAAFGSCKPDGQLRQHRAETSPPSYGAVPSSAAIRCIAWPKLLPHTAISGVNSRQTAGRDGSPNRRQRLSDVSCTQRIPAGLPFGIPGMGDEMEGAMQQAPQPGRHSMGFDSLAVGLACILATALAFPIA